MLISVINAQRALPIRTGRLKRLARCAIRSLGIRSPGRLEVTFIDARRMRGLNKQFLHHDRTTDVLSFRYDGRGNPAAQPHPAIVGEILIAPSAARAYGRRHGIPYAEELSRYVVHGLLHWLGHEDRTFSAQRKMRLMEDQLLARCAKKPVGVGTRDISIFSARKPREKIETSRRI